MKKYSPDSPITNYWYKFYCAEHCTICGNTGIIDSTGAETPAGVVVGRRNWCICPNGQVLRQQISPDGKTLPPA